MYVRPANRSDVKIIFEAYKERYNVPFPSFLTPALFDLVGGNIQYLQLALIILNEKKGAAITTEKNLFDALVIDERIILQSEELWESLTEDEQKALIKIIKMKAVTQTERELALYLWKTGFITENQGQTMLFNPLFTFYIEHKKEEPEKSSEVHLTKKEHLLFMLLESHVGEICERDQIIEVVWPEYKEFGVSDWAIDRLVARVRVKLREQKNKYEIVTIRTRGYKLARLK